MHQRGLLDVTVLQARGLRTGKMLEKIDPYVKLVVGQSAQQTGVHKKGGKNPRWDTDNHRSLTADTSQMLELSVWDKEYVTKDKLVGRTSVRVAQIAAMPSPAPRWTGGRLPELSPHAQLSACAAALAASFRKSSSCTIPLATRSKMASRSPN